MVVPDQGLGDGFTGRYRHQTVQMDWASGGGLGIDT